MGAARAMLHDHSLPFFLWAKAYSTNVYVQNKSLHRALRCKTLQEMLTEKMPEIGHFHIFGCLKYSHVPSEKRTTLEATGEGYFCWLWRDLKGFLHIPSYTEESCGEEGGEI